MLATRASARLAFPIVPIGAIGEHTTQQPGEAVDQLAVALIRGSAERQRFNERQTYLMDRPTPQTTSMPI